MSVYANRSVPEQPQTEAPPQPGRWQRFKDLVLLREFDRSERGYLVGQALFLTAISVYLATLPLMVHALTGDVAMLGTARAVHYWAFAAGSLFAGRINRVLPFKTALVGTSIARAVIFGAIGLLTIASGLDFVGFLFLAAASAVVASISHLNDTDAGGPAKVFSSNDKIERANYLYGTLKYGLLLTVPPLLGWFMRDGLMPLVGEAVTAGAGYVLFAALMALATYVYGKNVVDSGRELVMPTLRDAMRAALLMTLGGWRFGLNAVGGAARALMGPAGALARVKAWLAPALDLFRFMRRRSAVTTRAGLTVVEQFGEDALFNVVLPTYAFVTLGMGIFGAGLMSSFLYAGGLVASTMLVGLMRSLQARFGVYRVIQGLSLVAALAFIPTLGFWGAPSIWLAFPAAFMLKLMLQPMNSRMSALLQTELNRDAESRRHSDGVWTVITVLEVLAAGAGAITFSWLLTSPVTVFGAPVAMVAVTGLMAGLGVLYLLTPKALKDSLEPVPQRVTFSAPAGSNQGDEAARLAKLARNLEAAGLPPYKTLAVKGPAPKGEPVVVLLAPGSTHKIAMDREGGRQLPGGVHLALDPAWLEQEEHPAGPGYPDGFTKVFIRKGVVFDEKGQATLVEYETPREAGFFGNWLTQGANGTSEGEPYEARLQTAMSSSVGLEQQTNDKLLTRMVMAAVQAAAVPVTLALAMPQYKQWDSVRSFEGRQSAVAAAELPAAEIAAARAVRGPLDAFLKANAHPDPKVSRKVSIRAEGASGGGTRSTTDRDRVGVAARVFELLAEAGARPAASVTVEIEAGAGLPSATLRIPADGTPWAGGRRTAIREAVDGYLASYEGSEVVVKPSGPQFHSGYGVGFIGARQPAHVLGHFLALAADEAVTEDAAVLLDSRVDSAPIDRSGRPMETTLRVLAVRNKDAGFKTTEVFARVGPRGIPTTAEPPSGDPRDAATVEDWGRLLGEWRKAGLLDDAGVAALDAEVKALGPRVFAALDAYEKKAFAEKGRSMDAPYRARTDLIGLDVMIELRTDAAGKKSLVPVVIEINDHDAGGQHNLDQMFKNDPERVGAHSRELLATWIQEARRALLRGKRLVVVGAGYKGKKFIFERYKELGVRTVLVAPRDAFVEELLRENLLDEYIEADNAKPQEALARARKQLLRSIRRRGELDGITSSWEDDVPLTAMLARELGLRYHSVEAANAVRSKAETRRILNAADVSRVPVFKLRNPLQADAGLRNALKREFLARLEEIGFPAVLKPVYGAAAIGPKRIDRMEDALRVYDEVRAVVRPEVDAIFAQGTDLQLESYLDGQEYDIDVVMQGGEVTAATLTDNKPTREPYFQATGSVSPSRGLSRERQQDAISQAVAAAKALGLTDGVLHIEGKYTSRGPRIIEANGRMGGEYVWDWNKTVWGLDLVEEGAMAAVGIGGKPFVPSRPLAHLNGDFVMTEQHGLVSELDIDESVRAHPGFHSFTTKFRPGDIVPAPVSGTNRLGMLVARGATAEEAAANLRELQARLRVRVGAPVAAAP